MINAFGSIDELEKQTRHYLRLCLFCGLALKLPRTAMLVIAGDHPVMTANLTKMIASVDRVDESKVKLVNIY